MRSLSPARVRRPLLAALACALGTSGCALVSNDALLEARAQIREYAVDGSGAVYDSTLDATPEGVPGWLARDGVIVSVARQHDGRLELIAPPGRYLLLAGPTPACSDTLGEVRLASGHTTKWPAPIVLAPAGSLLITPSPTLGGLAAIRYGVSLAQRMVLCVRRLDGTIVTTLTDGPQEPGLYVVGWDRTDAAGQPVASGRYWVTLEHYPAPAGVVAPAGARGAPPGGTAPPGSPRRGERISFTVD